MGLRESGQHKPAATRADRFQVRSAFRFRPRCRHDACVGHRGGRAGGHVPHRRRPRSRARLRPALDSVQRQQHPRPQQVRQEPRAPGVHWPRPEIPRPLTRVPRRPPHSPCRLLATRIHPPAVRHADGAGAGVCFVRRLLQRSQPGLGCRPRRAGQWPLLEFPRPAG